jgi:hypothetical protein
MGVVGLLVGIGDKYGGRKVTEVIKKLPPNKIFTKKGHSEFQTAKCKPKFPNFSTIIVSINTSPLFFILLNGTCDFPFVELISPVVSCSNLCCCSNAGLPNDTEVCYVGLPTPPPPSPPFPLCILSPSPAKHPGQIKGQSPSPSDRRDRLQCNVSD